jgi:hypothetical protein
LFASAPEREGRRTAGATFLTQTRPSRARVCVIGSDVTAPLAPSKGRGKTAGELRMASLGT